MKKAEENNIIILGDNNDVSDCMNTTINNITQKIKSERTEETNKDKENNNNNFHFEGINTDNVDKTVDTLMKMPKFLEKVEAMGLSREDIKDIIMESDDEIHPDFDYNPFSPDSIKKKISELTKNNDPDTDDKVRLLNLQLRLAISLEFMNECNGSKRNNSVFKSKETYFDFAQYLISPADLAKFFFDEDNSFRFKSENEDDRDSEILSTAIISIDYVIQSFFNKGRDLFDIGFIMSYLIAIRPALYMLSDETKEALFSVRFFEDFDGFIISQSIKLISSLENILIKGGDERK